MKIKQRLALVEDKSRLVPYDSKEARFLFAAPDQEVPDALAEKYGLIDGMLPESEKPEAPVPEWEKEPDFDDPAWSEDPETGEPIYTHTSGDDVYINGVLQEPADEPPLPNIDDDDEQAEKAAEGDTPPEAGTEGEETPAEGSEQNEETETEEEEEVKKGDKPEDKQKAKPEDKRILKSENKREKGRR